MDLHPNFVRLLVPFRDRLLEQGGRLLVSPLGLQYVPEVLQDDRVVGYELQRLEEIRFGAAIIAAPLADYPIPAFRTAAGRPTGSAAPDSCR